MNIIFDYNEKENKASCIIEDKNIIGIGNATCHPDDLDVASERTGSYIAEERAKIHFLQNKNECKLKPSLCALKHLYSTMNKSLKFNIHSYEAKRIRKEIKNIEKEIQKNKDIIKNLQKNLKEYIDNKEKFANLYRTKNKIKNNSLVE